MPRMKMKTKRLAVASRLPPLYRFRLFIFYAAFRRNHTAKNAPKTKIPIPCMR